MDTSDKHPVMPSEEKAPTNDKMEAKGEFFNCY
jgi:hypothetical protein